MRNAEVINYKGVSIIYQDFSNLKEVDEIKAVVESGMALIRKQLPKTAFTISNMENMYFNNDLLNYFISAVRGNDVYVVASAVYGLNGLITIMYNGFVKLSGRDVRSFKTRDEALEYLYSKSKG